MLSALMLCALIGNAGSLLGVLGYRIRNRKLKKEIERLKNENEELNESVVDVLSNYIKDDHVRQYLKAVEEAGHTWKPVAESNMTWGYKPNTKTDTLLTEACKHCGMVRRYWERGLGTVEQPTVAGYWVDELKLDFDDHRRSECQAVAVKRKTPLLLSGSEEAEWKSTESSKSTSKTNKK